MKYMTYYEEQNTVTVGKYQQMKRSLKAGEQQEQMEKYTLKN